MKKKSLQYRLTINIVTIFSIVIISTTTVIYFAYERWMKNSVIEGLENKTLLAAFNFLEEDEIAPREHQKIKEKLRHSVSKEDIAIYNNKDIIVKGKMRNDSDITTKFLRSIQFKGQNSLITSKYFYNGLYYRDNEGDFIVVTRIDKSDFNTQLQSLLLILFMVCTGGIILIYIFSIYIGRAAYYPIVSMVEQIKERNPDNFQAPIILTNSYTEIDDLVITYNHLITLLSQIFTIQKNFIDYVSHELRTPIAAIMGTTEVSLSAMKNQDEEVRNEMLKIQRYVSDLEQNLNHLQLLSGSHTKISINEIRIDEVIWKVTELATQHYNSKINVSIDIQDYHQMIVKGDEKLLELAIKNIVDNAVKYSNKQPVDIHLYIKENSLNLNVHDRGIGIPKEDVDIVTGNFVRGKNTTGIEGKGIGLSLSNIIFKLHHIEMSILSEEKNTNILLKFPPTDFSNL